MYKSYVLKGEESSKPISVVVGTIDAFLKRMSDAIVFERVGDDPGGDHVTYVWEQTPNKERQVRLVDALVDGGRIIAVGGPDERTSEELAGRFVAEFSFHTIAEVVQRASVCTGANPGWIGLLAHAVNERFHADAHEVLSSHLRSADVVCRRKAAIAIGSLRWPEFLPSLRAARAAERDRGTRVILDVDIGLCEQEVGAVRPETPDPSG